MSGKKSQEIFKTTCESFDYWMYSVQDAEGAGDVEKPLLTP